MKAIWSLVGLSIFWSGFAVALYTFPPPKPTAYADRRVMELSAENRQLREENVGLKVALDRLRRELADEGWPSLVPLPARKLLPQNLPE